MLKPPETIGRILKVYAVDHDAQSKDCTAASAAEIH